MHAALVGVGPVRERGGRRRRAGAGRKRTAGNEGEALVWRAGRLVGLSYRSQHGARPQSWRTLWCGVARAADSSWQGCFVHALKALHGCTAGVHHVREGVRCGS